MGELTVKDLYNMCERLMLNGQGDKVVLVSDDDECNGYHALWQGADYNKESLQKFVDYGMIRRYDIDKVVAIG